MADGTYTWTVTISDEGYGMTIDFADGEKAEISLEDPDSFYTGMPEAIQSWLTRIGVNV